MMCRSWLTWVALACTCFSLKPGFAQQANPSQLQRLSDSLHLADQQAKARISSYAGRLNMLPAESTNGTKFLLVDIDRLGYPVYRMTLNAGAAKTTGADVLQNPTTSGLNITGRDILFGVWDGGRVKDHIELGARLVSVDGDEFSDHATHVTGTLISQGINPNAMGMAPSAQAATHYFGNDLAVIAGLASSATPYIISNHSYGEGTGWIRDGNSWTWAGNPAISATEDYRFGLYGTRAAILDQIAYLAPSYSIFWATGNDRSDTGNGSRPADCNGGTGYDCIIPDAVAKNIFTIGAVNKVQTYTNPSSVVMGTYSSWGPTDDGRIKPDLVAAGTDLFSLSATGTNTYEVMGGTSMATPNAAGSLGLVQQLYSDLHGGAFMSSAMLKCLAIHTAKEAGPFPGPDYSYGWGLVDVAAAADVLLKKNGVDKIVQEVALQNGQKYERVITPAVGKKITATIAWTDPAGTPLPESLDPTTLALVNDLDLRIIDEAGIEQRPWILDPLNPVKQASRGDNFRDNVEKVEVNTPTAARYRVVVSHKGQLKNGIQKFSLVLTYQDVNSPSTFYWIGNNGNWTDGSHWSLSTGGVAANQVPKATDRVIFDENSFSFDQATVALSSDQTCASITWVSSRLAGIDLSNHTLTITESIRVRHAGDFANNGTIALRSSSTGRIDWEIPAAINTNVAIESGTWDIYGSARIGNLASNSTFTASKGFLSVSNLTATNPISLVDTKLEVRDQLSVPTNPFTSPSESSEVSVLGDSDQTITGLDWPATLRIGGKLRINGKSKIGQVEVEGMCTLETDNRVGLLSLSPGAQLLISNATTQTIDSLAISGLANKRTQITTASGASFISLGRHRRYCFDYIDINSVSVLMTTINAGPNSTVTAGVGWQTVPCDQMLFADFTWSYACTNSLAQFKDRSVGSPDGWSWSMNGLGQTLRAEKLTDQNPYFEFPAAGSYPVSLTLTKGNLVADVVEKVVAVTKNYLDENEVVPSGQMLQSKNVGTRYQWLLDGEPINGAIDRAYNFGGVPGIYQVAAYDKTCNSLSKPFLVTGLNTSKQEVTVTPNPAADRIEILGVNETVQVFATDLTGWERPIVRGNISELPNALYVLKIVVDGQTYYRKLVVAR